MRLTASRLILLLLLCLPSLTARAVTPYPFGSLPSSPADADVTTAYTLWKGRHYI